GAVLGDRDLRRGVGGPAADQQRPGGDVESDGRLRRGPREGGNGGGGGGFPIFPGPAGGTRGAGGPGGARPPGGGHCPLPGGPGPRGGEHGLVGGGGFGSGGGTGGRGDQEEKVIATAEAAAESKWRAEVRGLGWSVRSRSDRKRSCAKERMVKKGSAGRSGEFA